MAHFYEIIFLHHYMDVTHDSFPWRLTSLSYVNPTMHKTLRYILLYHGSRTVEVESKA